MEESTVLVRRDSLSSSSLIPPFLLLVFQRYSTIHLASTNRLTSIIHVHGSIFGSPAHSPPSLAWLDATIDSKPPNTNHLQEKENTLSYPLHQPQRAWKQPTFLTNHQSLHIHWLLLPKNRKHSTLHIQPLPQRSDSSHNPFYRKQYSHGTNLHPHLIPLVIKVSRNAQWPHWQSPRRIR